MRISKDSMLTSRANIVYLNARPDQKRACENAVAPQCPDQFPPVVAVTAYASIACHRPDKRRKDNHRWLTIMQNRCYSAYFRFRPSFVVAAAMASVSRPLVLLSGIEPYTGIDIMCDKWKDVGSGYGERCK